MFQHLYKTLVLGVFLVTLFLLGASVWKPETAFLCVLSAAGLLLLPVGLLFSPFPFQEKDQAGWFLGHMIRVPFRWAGLLAFLLALVVWLRAREDTYLLSAACLVGYVGFLFLLRLVLRVFRPVPGMDYI